MESGAQCSVQHGDEVKYTWEKWLPNNKCTNDVGFVVSDVSLAPLFGILYYIYLNHIKGLKKHSCFLNMDFFLQKKKIAEETKSGFFLWTFTALSDRIIDT